MRAKAQVISQWILCLIVLAVSITLAAGARVTLAQTFKMKMSTPTINDVNHQWIKRFKARIEKRVGDRLKVEIYPASQLGSIPRQVDGLLTGTIESFTSPPSFVVGSAPKWQIFDAPGLFDSPQHVNRVVSDKDFREHFLKLGEDKGFKPIGIFFNSGLNVLSRKPIRRLADFRGKKIRTFSSPLQTVPMEVLGATPVPMPLIEVLPALQSGTIDGLLAGITIMSAFKYYDTAKPVTVTDHTLLVSVTYLSKIWFDRLPKDLQQAIVEEGSKVDQEIFEWALWNLKRTYKVWTDNGGELIHLSADEQAKMMKDMARAGAEVLSKDPGVKAEYDILTKFVEKHR